MNTSHKKYLKIFAIAVGIIVILAIAAYGFLMSISTPIIPNDAELVTDGRYNKYSDVDLVREITNVPDFPAFDSEVYEYINEAGVKEIYLKCVFNPAIPEDSLCALRDKMEGEYFEADKDGWVYFVRGWSKKEYMEIPAGIEEEMVFKIEMNSQGGEFYISYKKNPCPESVAKDSLNHYLGVALPEFTIINYIAPDKTTILLKEPVSSDTYSLLEKNEWCDHKTEDDGTSYCFIDKKEPGKYSTSIFIDDQKHTAVLSRSEN